MDADTARQLRRLLDTRPVAALGTLHRGEPAVSMVPFVLPLGSLSLLIHVSALATHTADLRDQPRASLLVMDEAGPRDATSAPGTPAPSTGAEAPSPLSLARVTLRADARFLERGTAEDDAARAAYRQRFPEADITLGLGDFSMVALTPLSARLVAGFGRAYSLAGEPLADWLRGAGG